MKRPEARRALRRLANDLVGIGGRTQEQQAVRGFVLGALFALDVALELRFKARLYPTRSRAYDGEITRHLRTLGAGMDVTRGKWLAGFYFNSCLQHLAGAYHRLLKLVTGTDHTVVPCLVDIGVAQGRFAYGDVDALTEVHRDVNDLKHAKPGVLKRRRVMDVDFALQAAGQAVALYKQIR